MVVPAHFIKSPLNYIGGKHKLLPQMFPLFPETVGTFVDLFAGGGDVFINVQADRIIANDLNHHIIGLYRAFQSFPAEVVIERIEKTIADWKLSSTNEDAYKRFRAYYNETKDPIDLYILVCHSFNYQFRFNSHHRYNNPFGKNRSWFNPTLRNNLILFLRHLQDIELCAENFKAFDFTNLQKGDFVYADPPYLIATGSYNDGKRGFEGWGDNEDIVLYERLDELNSRNVRFALSNVLEHKGKTNVILDDWRRQYHTHFLSKNYCNSSYHAKNTDKRTYEVLITNYS